MGLRGRVMVAYGLLALGLSGALALVTWSVVSNYLTEQRESSAEVETADNAAAFRYGLFGAPQPCRPAREHAECADPLPLPNVSVMELLNSLPSTDAAASMVYYDEKYLKPLRNYAAQPEYNIYDHSVVQWHQPDQVARHAWTDDYSNLVSIMR